MNKFLLHVSAGLRRPVDPDSVYYLEAVADDTVLRRRGARPLKDVRPLSRLVFVAALVSTRVQKREAPWFLAGRREEAAWPLGRSAVRRQHGQIPV